MEKEIKLIVCDVDGTILPSGKYEISERLREDFHKAMKKGIKVLINTGRHYTFLPQSFFKDLPMDRIGTINGACLVDRNGNNIGEPMLGGVDDEANYNSLLEQIKAVVEADNK